MLLDIVDVKPLGGYRLWLKFEDGVEGIIDFKEHTSLVGVYEPLNDPAYFAQVRVNPDWGTICWPNDADADPMVLYEKINNHTKHVKRIVAEVETA